MNVTPNVIADLWALAAAGEASDDSRRLVEEFLARDPELADRLRANGRVLDPAVPSELPPDHEARTLERTKRQLRRRSPFYLLALAFTGLAVARIIEDTTFERSPVRFIATSVVAIVCWTLYSWHTQRMREAKLPKAR